MGRKSEVCNAKACPVHGGFTRWSAYTGPCSLKCGGGTRIRTRTCTKPRPSNGGKPCTGATRKSEVCNAKACPGPKPTVPIFGKHKEITVCERKKGKISCPSGLGINILHASYGRNKRRICLSKGSMGNTHCHASTSLPVVRNLCNKYRSCILEAENKIFGDPCYGTYKFLNVRYNCVKINHKDITVCEGKVKTVYCPAGHVVNIIAASYGRHSLSICSRHGSMGNADCAAHKTLSVLKNACKNNNYCKLFSSNRQYGDPCHGTY